MSSTPKAVGRRLKELRLEHGLSQRELATPGVTYAYVSRLEAGARQASIRALIKLADKLDTTALYLLTGEEHAHCPMCGRDAVEHEKLPR
jgi:transcriptional regulator with XRE-family HTH domain